MSDLTQNELQNTTNVNDADKKKPGRKSKAEVDNLGNIQVLEYPNRTLPKLIEQLLEKGFSVILSKDGYYVGGFYGLNPEVGKGGYAFAQDTSEANTLVFHDIKGYKHLIRNFDELVHFNSHVWGMFYKVSDLYKKPDTQWFPYMIELGALNITPGGR